MVDYDYSGFSVKDWEKIIRTHEIPEKILEEYACQYDEYLWRLICQYQKLSSKFILEFKYEIPMMYLLSLQVVHQNVIERDIEFFKDHMYHICKHQYLSEEFILKYKDIVSWESIFRYQRDLSFIFIKRTFSRYFGKQEYLDSNRVSQYFSNEIYMRYSRKLGRILAQHNQKVSTIRDAKRTLTNRNY